MIKQNVNLLSSLFAVLSFVCCGQSRIGDKNQPVKSLMKSSRKNSDFDKAKYSGFSLYKEISLCKEMGNPEMNEAESLLDACKNGDKERISSMLTLFSENPSYCTAFDFSVADQEGFGILYWAIKQQNQELLDFLMSLLSLGNPQINGRFLLDACIANDPDLVSNILTNIPDPADNIDLNVNDTNGWGIFHWAIINKNPIILELLMQADFNPWLCIDESGMSAVDVFFSGILKKNYENYDLCLYNPDPAYENISIPENRSWEPNFIPHDFRLDEVPIPYAGPLNTFFLKIIPQTSLSGSQQIPLWQKFLMYSVHKNGGFNLDSFLCYLGAVGNKEIFVWVFNNLSVFQSIFNFSPKDSLSMYRGDLCSLFPFWCKFSEENNMAVEEDFNFICPVFTILESAILNPFSLPGGNVAMCEFLFKNGFPIVASKDGTVKDILTQSLCWDNLEVFKVFWPIFFDEKGKCSHPEKIDLYPQNDNLPTWLALLETGLFNDFPNHRKNSIINFVFFILKNVPGSICTFFGNEACRISFFKYCLDLIPDDESEDTFVDMQYRNFLHLMYAFNCFEVLFGRPKGDVRLDPKWNGTLGVLINLFSKNEKISLDMLYDLFGKYVVEEVIDNALTE